MAGKIKGCAVGERLKHFQPPLDSDVSWQQLIVLACVLGEVIDAMERERATSRRPLHQSWQNFVYQLRLKKPKLGTRLDHWLRDGFFDEPGGAQ